MIDAVIDVEGSTLETIQGVLRDLLEGGVVDALLVPMRMPAGAVAPMLVADPDSLDQADPLAPVLAINGARAVSQLTMTGHGQELGVVLRACEIRALVELVKFQQVKLEKVLIVGVDCLGTYPVTAWQGVSGREEVVEELLAGAVTGDLRAQEGMEFRAACQMCEQPLPEGGHVALTIGLVGVERGKVYLKAEEGLAASMGWVSGETPSGRAEAVERLVAARAEARDGAYAGFRERVKGEGDSGGMEGLLTEFASCIRCHNCMINCPICYCRECIVRTPTFEHESRLYYEWAERKGSVRMLSDTLLFHLTRLNHMVTSCVGCGMCTEACPVEIPVGTVFRAVGERVQGIFGYHPGRSVEEAAPVQEFREDELTALGKRPQRPRLA